MSRWLANTRKRFHRVVYALGIWATKGWKSKVAESWSLQEAPAAGTGAGTGRFQSGIRTVSGQG